MLFHRSLPWLIALCVSASLAHAQTTPPASLPSPVLVPFDAPRGVEAAPDDNKKRAFQITLRNVSPLVMAFWLDPKNHPAPLGAPPSPLNYLSPDVLDGIDRIVPIAPQKSLLVFGTSQAAKRLQRIIDTLDTPSNPVPAPPQITLTPSVIRQPVTFALSLYWIDSLAPEKQFFQTAASAPHLAREDEITRLADLMEREHATDRPLPTVTGATSTINVLPFGRLGATTSVTPPGVDPHFSLPKRQLNKPRPNDPFSIDPDSSIDPGIQGNELAPPLPMSPPTFLLPSSQNNLTMMPFFGKDGQLVMLVNGADLQPVLLPLNGDDTILISGAAKDWGLTPPSTRFDTFVLLVQPRIQNTVRIGPQQPR